MTRDPSSCRTRPARRLTVLLVAVSATGVWFGTGGPVEAAPTQAAASEPAAVPGELLVGYRIGATTEQRANARSRATAQLQDRVVKAEGTRTEVELVRIPQGSDRSAAARRLRDDPAVAYAQPNWILTHAVTSTDPYYTTTTPSDQLWGMYGDGTAPANSFGSQAGEAWADNSTGSDTVYVGIIDEGIDYLHEDLAPNIGTNPGESGAGKETNGADDDNNGYVDDVRGWDFANNNNTIYDGGTGDKHGTHVAGTIGALGGNGKGVAGVNWNVKMLSGKFLGANGGTTANAVKAVDYFTNLKTRTPNPVNIVATNNSWGGGGNDNALFDAIGRANTAGILFIAAAGNEGSDNDTTVRYPSGYNLPNIIAVASIAKDGTKSSFSNYGANSVDIGAPGSGIWSTLPGNTYGSYNGTSMATPHVTGAVALFKSKNPNAGVSEVKAALYGWSVPTASLAGKTATGSRLNVGGNSFTGVTSAPSSPKDLSASTAPAPSGKTTVTLNWAAPFSDGGEPTGFAYQVVRTMGGAQTSFSPVGTTYTDTVSDGTYTYEVVASNVKGKGAPSAPAVVIAGGTAVTNVVRVTSPNGTNGYSLSRKNLLVKVNLLDATNAVVANANVTVAIDYRKLASAAVSNTYSGTSATNSAGDVSFQILNAPAGFYSTRVTAVSDSRWDGKTPTNEYQKK